MMELYQALDYSRYRHHRAIDHRQPSARPASVVAIGDEQIDLAQPWRRA
jgi:hypothetical protein